MGARGPARQGLGRGNLVSHLASGGDSYRPAGIHFEGERHNASPRSLPPELEELAYEAGIDPSDIPPVRYADPRTQSNQSAAARGIMDIVRDNAEDLPSDLPSKMSAHEMRRQLRAIGIDLGHSTDDSQDRRSTARHEAAHAAVAHALRWQITSVNIAAGETKFDLPPYSAYETLSERNLAFGMIGAAGAAASGWSSDWEENANDRIALRAKGIDFEEARKSAEALLAEPDGQACHQRLTDALIQTGELHGESLRRVLEG
jgi:hypothetical protein